MIAESPQASSSTGSSDFNNNFSGMFSLTPFIGACIQSESLWIIDTGATHHVSCYASNFQSATPLSLKVSSLFQTHRKYPFLA